MPVFETVKVAAIQACPLILDAEATTDKAWCCHHRPRGGKIVAGPLYDEEGIVTAEIDLKVGLHAKRWFDVVGHYKRIDPGASHPDSGGEGWPSFPVSDT